MEKEVERFFYVQSSVLSAFCIAADKMEDERTPNITPKLATDNKKPNITNQ